MSDLPMMPWWPKDFISATRAYRLAERGAYRDLLDFQWELGVLPNDTKVLARLLGVTQEEFDDVWQTIQAKFIQRDGGLVNERLEKHREKALARRDKQRRGAAKTNAGRDQPTTLSDTVSGAVSDTLSGAHPSPSPSPIKSTTTDDHGRSSPPRGWPKNWDDIKEGHFNAFKSRYPKRGGNQPWARARKAINARLSEKYTWKQIIDGAERYARFCETTGKIETETVMQAATFCGRDTLGFTQAWTIPKKPLSLEQANRICVRQAKTRRTAETDDEFIGRMRKFA